MTGAERRLRVGVVFGGRSGEHEVSLLSAASVMAALDPAAYEVVPIGIAKDGRWLAGPAALEHLRREARLPASGAMKALAAANGRHDPTAVHEVGLLPDPSRHGVLAVQPAGGLMPVAAGSGFAGLDVVFPVLHGPFGEDGTIQGLLELAGLPYVGAGVLGSALGMDKIAMKDVFRANGLPVVRYLAVARSAFEAAPDGVLRQIQSELGLPYFVKPANLGSSVGITKVRQAGDLARAIRIAAHYDRRIIVEEAAPNAREIECSVLGNDDPVASVPGEVIPSREFYDYAAKYIDEDSTLVIPADLPPAVAAAVRQIAIRAFRSVDCSGMARVDFFVGRDDHRITLNELNTIPGFTTISMYPKLWQASGLSYERLLQRLIELAIERHSDRQRSATTYAPEDEPVSDGGGGE